MTGTGETPTTASIAERARGDDDEDAPVAREREGEAAGDADALEPLLGDDEAGSFRERWHKVQASFVDEPRTSVEQADALVAELMQRLAETFAEEREQLESQWSRGEDVSTEDLRVALQRYRSFFERLLAA
jgi:polyhydroxyalkanoate synthesis regulator phasin